MFQTRRVATLAIACVLTVGVFAKASNINGHYMEARTCQVYTGPCFANAETGLAGKDAVMAWSIKDGKHQGVDLTGLKVVVAVHASDTLGFGGLKDAKSMKSVVYVDDKANKFQREALIDFAKVHSGPAGDTIVRITDAPISMSLNELKLTGALNVGKDVKLITRKAGRGDCICSNESAYYPPLAQVEYFAPGVTTEGEFKGRGLGSRWSTPGDRSSYMATFAY